MTAGLSRPARCHSEEAERLRNSFFGNRRITKWLSRGTASNKIDTEVGYENLRYLFDAVAAVDSMGGGPAPRGDRALADEPWRHQQFILHSHERSCRHARRRAVSFFAGWHNDRVASAGNFHRSSASVRRNARHPYYGSGCCKGRTERGDPSVVQDAEFRALEKRRVRRDYGPVFRRRREGARRSRRETSRARLSIGSWSQRASSCPSRVSRPRCNLARRRRSFGSPGRPLRTLLSAGEARRFGRRAMPGGFERACLIELPTRNWRGRETTEGAKGAKKGESFGDAEICPLCHAELSEASALHFFRFFR